MYIFFSLVRGWNFTLIASVPPSAMFSIVYMHSKHQLILLIPAVSEITSCIASWCLPVVIQVNVAIPGAGRVFSSHHHVH